MNELIIEVVIVIYQTCLMGYIRRVFKFFVEPGESTWLVRLVLKDENSHVDAVVTNGGLDRFALKTTYLYETTFTSVPTVGDLFDDEWREMAQEIISTTVAFLLYGSAMSHQMNSREVVSDIGQPREVMGDVT